MLFSLASCGGGGGGGGGSITPPGGTWQANVFLPSSQFDDMCVAPRPNTQDHQGTVLDQNN